MKSALNSLKWPYDPLHQTQRTTTVNIYLQLYLFCWEQTVDVLNSIEIWFV